MSDTWIDDALTHEPVPGATTVDGAVVRWLTWGDPDSPGLVLVHGGAAHARWWSVIAPLLARSYRVLAVDLSGHGDSDWRSGYSIVGWAGEVMAVARDAGLRDRFVLVGHSMGGFVSITAAALHGEHLHGAVIVDSPVRRADPESEEGRRGRAFRNPKSYPDLDAALRHFHLIPPQPVVSPRLVDLVARASLRHDGDGWTWKFDPKVFARTEPTPLHEHLASVRCRVAVFHGEHSGLVTPDVSEFMFDTLGRVAPFVEIPAAWHHLILDQPLAFVAALRAILADWDHSVPHRPHVQRYD